MKYIPVQVLENEPERNLIEQCKLTIIVSKDGRNLEVPSKSHSTGHGACKQDQRPGTIQITKPLRGWN